MEYPIVENGKEIGRLMARQEGLYTVFEARLPSRPALTRLYLCGGGESRLLGVMEPGDDGCRLCRRLSRRELTARIEYASTSPGEKPAAPKEAVRDEGWIPGRGGMLYHEERRLLAIPAGLRPGSKKARTMSLHGKEYIVFRW